MKYIPLHLLILTGATLSLSACFRNFDYDVTREHDIYRMDYKYKRPAETPSEAAMPGPAGAPPAPAPTVSATAPLPGAATPTAPTPAPAAAAPALPTP